MDRNILIEIISTYEKYDWTLREILVSEDSTEDFDAYLRTKFKDIEIRPSAIPAAWFSRPSKHDQVAWELRFIGEQPLALFETFPADFSRENRKNARKEMETRLAKLTSKN